MSVKNRTTCTLIPCVYLRSPGVHWSPWFTWNVGEDSHIARDLFYLYCVELRRSKQPPQTAVLTLSILWFICMQLPSLYLFDGPFRVCQAGRCVWCIKHAVDRGVFRRIPCHQTVILTLKTPNTWSAEPLRTKNIILHTVCTCNCDVANSTSDIY